MRNLTSLFAGLLFGCGLILSGMTQPGKVIGFLDLAGNWDPSLAFVMGGALLVAIPAFWFAQRRQSTLLGDLIALPTVRQIDRRLVLGATTFGIGWGLAGYCPGPAIASLISGNLQAVTFVVAMLVGMLLFEVVERHQSKRESH
ncbi:YeeE/YedE family protein [uncultured Oxalicibacterium sp.]|uniref:YeeE/YedE family protein n=1 Tax=uncultured Oxalicibacterium sp. TaxID=1168540 RepID=UPI0025DB0820|nr:YeeE/YedE family protein [uncultured Oxalicibacterium sp.]